MNVLLEALLPADDDAILLRAWQRRQDASAFAHLCRRHSGLVATASRRLGSADIDEATQSVFIILAQRPDAVRNVRGFAGWLLYATRRVVAAQPGIKTGRQHHHGEACRAPSTPAARDQDGQAWQDVRHLFDECLETLKPHQSEAVIRYHLAGHSHQQIAEYLHRPTNMVAQLIQEGLAGLRSVMARRGADISLAVLMRGLASETSVCDQRLTEACSQNLPPSHISPGMARIVAHCTRAMFFKRSLITMCLVAVIALGTSMAAFLAEHGIPARDPPVGDLSLIHARPIEASGIRSNPQKTGPGWKDGPAPAHPRTGHTAVLLSGNRVLVLGGEIATVARTWSRHPVMAPGTRSRQEDPNNPEIYDANNGTWTHCAPLLDSRQTGSFTATVCADGKVLVVGGIVPKGKDPTADQADTSHCERFDPNSGAWLATAPLIHERWRHAALLLPDGTVLVAGGESPNGTLSITCEIYDPVHENWTMTASMSDTHAGHPALTLLGDGNVLVSGGVTCEIYEPGTRTWHKSGSMVNSRICQTITVLKHGEVLATGGDIDGIAVASCELYDSKSGTWHPTGKMAAACIDYAVALLPNGHVLAIGGSLLGVPTATCEDYDPVSGSWSPAPALMHARAGHCAITLGNGDVLTIGGGNRQTKSTSEPNTSSIEAPIPSFPIEIYSGRTSQQRAGSTGP